MKGWSPVLVWLILGSALLMLGGCAGTNDEPTIITLWHNYGGQLKETMDQLIDEFNETAGAEAGIIISVTSISGAAAIHEKLVMAANEEPGAPALPDITIAYPKTALLLAEKGLLVELDQFFTPEELAAYLPQFLEEGRLAGEQLYVFPTAKSTEVLFLNRTIFDRFAGESGASLDELGTFEGIARTAALYDDWAKRQDPKEGLRTFFMSDSLFNHALVGCRQLGAAFIDQGAINFASPQYRQVWESYFRAAVQGRYTLYDGYAADLFKTGEIICSTGSTAGVMFFPDAVTYPDNTTEPAELTILPYPVFEGGRKAALQRGAGMCVTRSTGEKERLAAVFLKWFTDPRNNLRFVASTGYLPVTGEAFDELISRESEAVSDRKVRELLTTCQQMQQEYEFFVPPLFEGIDQLQLRYEETFKKTAAAAADRYRQLSAGSDLESACDAAVKQAFADLPVQFQGNS